MLESIKKRARKGRFSRVATTGKEFVWHTAAPARFMARWRTGRHLSASSNFDIPRAKGYAPFDPSAFGGTDGLVAAGREIISRWEREGASLSSSGKLYFHSVLKPDDLERYPAIMQFALNRDLLGSLSRYYGALPELCSLGLMLSMPQSGEKLVGSQRVHFDAFDSHHVKVIVAVEDVGVENGALEFYPADESAAIAAKFGARYSAHFRCDDDRFFKHADRSRMIAASVPAGHGFVLDTSTCLHFGSRVKSGRRLMWFIHFATFSQYEKMQATANGSLLFQNLPGKSKFATDRAASLALAM
jgi:hypothetical protein